MAVDDPSMGPSMGLSASGMKAGVCRWQPAEAYPRTAVAVAVVPVVPGSGMLQRFHHLRVAPVAGPVQGGGAVLAVVVLGAKKEVAPPSQFGGRDGRGQITARRHSSGW
ncbi:hypothetical protein TSOC_003499 [Tetrabaena socialis]|uniref:Uncharacterized protein n=1 Tax=Tetrabaena socialis TaxID=47790 RepID=A0A2J8ABI0_9CHLO|nr:hypothetical protein TSOC_003499 [Tetrabaena socialis]|eukprot:PNH09857.1 hypothetical protein TSOC_003499 [Tetrabaena socialis]